MTTDRVSVYSTNKSFEAEMIKVYLSDHNINAFILNKMDSAYHFGEVEILVLRDNAIRSKQLIAKFFENE